MPGATKALGRNASPYNYSVFTLTNQMGPSSTLRGPDQRPLSARCQASLGERQFAQERT
jgi:hypothetical protein